MSDEDEEPVDVRPAIVEKCKAKAENAKLFSEYIKCSERIKKKGHGECTGQYFDFWKSMDKCVRVAVIYPSPPLSLYTNTHTHTHRTDRRRSLDLLSLTDRTRGL